MAESQPPQTDDISAALLARAQAAVADKTARGIYSADFRSRLAEPLDIRVDPAFAAGASWDEALRTVTISPDPPIISTRPVIGPVIRMLKNLVRRSLRWYLSPVTAQATSHNQAVVEVLADHSRHIVELRREVEQLRRRVEALEAEHSDAEASKPA